MTGESSRLRWPGMVKATAGRSPAHAGRVTSGKSPVRKASVRMQASARTGKLPSQGEGGGEGTGTRVVHASGDDGGSGEARGGGESYAGDATWDVRHPTEDGDCGRGEMAVVASTMPPMATGRTPWSRLAAAAEVTVSAAGGGGGGGDGAGTECQGKGAGGDRHGRQRWGRQCGCWVRQRCLVNFFRCRKNTLHLCRATRTAFFSREVLQNVI
jgi:hypothetical protein